VFIVLFAVLVACLLCLFACLLVYVLVCSVIYLSTSAFERLLVSFG
jgi:hypothetical protein